MFESVLNFNLGSDLNPSPVTLCPKNFICPKLKLPI